MNWIQDLFPEVASALAVQGPGWLERPLRNLRNRSLMAARRNVVIGEGMEKRLRGEGIPSASIRVIHNWADGLAIQPVDPKKNELRREWNLEDRFVVGYSGNFREGLMSSARSFQLRRYYEISPRSSFFSLEPARNWRR